MSKTIKKTDWQPTSWQKMQAAQQATYPDGDALGRAVVSSERSASSGHWKCRVATHVLCLPQMPALVRKDDLEDLSKTEAHHGDRGMMHLRPVELNPASSNHASLELSTQIGRAHV